MVISNPELLETYSPNDDIVYYVYFLWYDNDILYIGQTTNIDQRINNHKSEKLFNKVTYQKYTDVSSREILAIEAVNIAHYNPCFNNNPSGIYYNSKFFNVRGNKTMWEYNVVHNPKSAEGLFIYCEAPNQPVYSVKHSQKCYEIHKNHKCILREPSHPDCVEVICYLDANKDLVLKQILKVEPPVVRKAFTLYKNTKINFGKYKNQTVKYVIQNDINYFRWMLSVKSYKLSQEVKDLLR